MAYLTNAKVKLPNGKTKDIHKVPDMPVATITYDKVEGRFTHNDGTVRILTGGPGTMSVRQWHASSKGTVHRYRRRDQVREQIRHIVIDCGIQIYL